MERSAGRSPPASVPHAGVGAATGGGRPLSGLPQASARCLRSQDAKQHTAQGRC